MMIVVLVSPVYHEVRLLRRVISVLLWLKVGTYPHIPDIFIRNYDHRPTLGCRQYRSIFVEIFLVGSEFLFILQEGHFGRSRSPNFTDVGANRKRLCDFLLVRNS